MQMNRKEFLSSSLAALGVGITGFRSGGDDSQPSASAFRKAVEQGNMKTIRNMLEADPALALSRDIRGLSMVFIAHLAGHQQVRDLLAGIGAELNLVDAIVVGDDERIDWILEHLPGQARQINGAGWSPWIAALSEGREDLIFKLIRAAGSYDIVADEQGAPAPLGTALSHPDAALSRRMAYALLSNGADPNIPHTGGRRPLHLAAANGDDIIVELLLRKGADPALKDEKGQTALDTAVRQNNRRITDLLNGTIAVLPDPTDSRCAFDADGAAYTPPPADLVPAELISTFSGSCHTNLVLSHRLLSACPMLAHTNASWNEMGVEAGAHMARPDIVEPCLQHGAPMSLQTAVCMNRADRVQALMEAFPDTYAERGPHDWPLLAYAARKGTDISILAFLLEKGADPAAQNLGGTVLHYAAVDGEVDKIEMLISHGADPSRPRLHKDGATPLELAKSRGHTQAARLLADAL